VTDAAVSRASQPLSHKEMIEGARRDHGMDVVNHYNFGVSGLSGVGKSSLINAIRGILDTDPGAAPVSLE
jgi:putative ribosome biogenesis GTPase RsgA